jgi:hypothetical protein
MSVNDYMPILERALSETTLAWTSGLFQATNTTSLHKIVERPGTRYPLLFLIALGAVYGLYAGMALYIAVLPAFVTSPAIVVQNPVGEQEKVSVLELVAIRLANVYPLIGDFMNTSERSESGRHSGRDTSSDVALRSAANDMDDMFEEDVLQERSGWVLMSMMGDLV